MEPSFLVSYIVFEVTTRAESTSPSDEQGF
jgi:hypothetical protein